VSSVGFFFFYVNDARSHESETYSILHALRHTNKELIEIQRRRLNIQGKSQKIVCLNCKFLIIRFTVDFKLDGSILSTQMNYLKGRKGLSRPTQPLYCSLLGYERAGARRFRETFCLHL